MPNYEIKPKLFRALDHRRFPKNLGNAWLNNNCRSELFEQWS